MEVVVLVVCVVLAVRAVPWAVLSLFTLPVFLSPAADQAREVSLREKELELTGRIRLLEQAAAQQRDVIVAAAAAARREAEEAEAKHEVELRGMEDDVREVLTKARREKGELKARVGELEEQLAQMQQHLALAFGGGGAAGRVAGVGDDAGAQDRQQRGAAAENGGRNGGQGKNGASSSSKR